MIDPKSDPRLSGTWTKGHESRKVTRIRSEAGGTFVHFDSLEFPSVVPIPGMRSLDEWYAWCEGATRSEEP